jgi:hypothetical protein
MHCEADVGWGSECMDVSENIYVLLGSFRKQFVVPPAVRFLGLVLILLQTDANGSIMYYQQSRMMDRVAYTCMGKHAM